MLGRYARQFEFAADDAAEFDAADRAGDEHLLRVGQRAHTAVEADLEILEACRFAQGDARERADAREGVLHAVRHFADHQLAFGGAQRLFVGERLESADAALLERSEEHTSELQSLMRISYAVFCLKKK